MPHPGLKFGIRYGYLTILSFVIILIFIFSNNYEFNNEFNVHLSRNLNSIKENVSCWKNPHTLNNIIKQQKIRHHNINAVCSSRNNSTKIAVKYLNNILVDNENQILYCAIPKVACTNWKKTIISINGRGKSWSNQNSSIPVHDLHFLSNLGFYTLDRYSKDEILYFLKNYYKFMFVRNPFERLISAYRDKFNSYDRYTRYFQKKYGRQMIHLFRENATMLSLSNGHDVQFKEFIKYLIYSHNKNFSFNPHWDTFDNICHPCLIHYDFIGKLSSIETDAMYVTNMLTGTCHTKYFSISNMQNNWSSSTNLKEYYHRLPKEDIKSVLNIYKVDFDMFGYSSSLYYS